MKARIGIILGGIVLLMILFKNWPSNPLNAKSSAKTPSSFLKNLNTAHVPLLPDSYKEISPSSLRAEILQEVEKSQTLDQNPEATEIRLNLLAQSLSSAEIHSLSELITKPSRNGDLRALAADLLARNQSEEVLPALAEAVISKWPKSGNSQIEALEQVLRARVIEGLQNHPSEKANIFLQQVLTKTEDSFLLDRGRRAYLFRQGQVSSLQDQDHRALEKLLQR